MLLTPRFAAASAIASIVPLRGLKVNSPARSHDRVPVARGSRFVATVSRNALRRARLAKSRLLLASSRLGVLAEQISLMTNATHEPLVRLAPRDSTLRSGHSVADDRGALGHVPRAPRVLVHGYAATMRIRRMSPANLSPVAPLRVRAGDPPGRTKTRIARRRWLRLVVRRRASKRVRPYAEGRTRGDSLPLTTPLPMLRFAPIVRFATSLPLVGNADDPPGRTKEFSRSSSFASH